MIFIKLMNKKTSYIVFMVFYCTEMRLGELLALTPSDIHLDEKYISITKSYQRIEEEDLITDPKTTKSKRNITIPDFLVENLKEYIDSLYNPDPHEQLFRVTKSFIEKEINSNKRCVHSIFPPVSMFRIYILTRFLLFTHLLLYS